MLSTDRVVAVGVGVSGGVVGVDVDTGEVVPADGDVFDVDAGWVAPDDGDVFDVEAREVVENEGDSLGLVLGRVGSGVPRQVDVGKDVVRNWARSCSGFHVGGAPLKPRWDEISGRGDAPDAVLGESGAAAGGAPAGGLDAGAKRDAPE
ncbi:MAG: hypothetical protein JWM82_1616 [Myxococcales bacterium]|nr:hypothetical protein [Myxococcales bacterium]